MKRIRLFVLLAAVACFCFLMVGCGGNPLTEEQLDEMGYTVIVRYDFNGGQNTDNMDGVTIRVKKGARIPKPGDRGVSFSAPSKAKCTIRGFYTGEKSEDGTVVLDRAWDFSNDRVNENITLYAGWWDDYVVHVHCDDGDTDRIKEFTVSRDTETGEANMVYAENYSASLLEMSGRTIIDYYYDAEKQQKIEFPTVFPFEDNEDGRTINIYVKSLAGNWTVISTAEQLEKGFGEYDNVYLKNDIDMQGKAAAFPSEYYGTFDGNGCTVSNLSREITVTKYDSTICLGLFGRLNKTASVKDVTFDNISVNLTLSSNKRIKSYFIGLFAGLAETGAVLDNVTVTSGRLTYEEVEGAIITSENPFIGQGYPSDSMTNCQYNIETNKGE